MNFFNTHVDIDAFYDNIFYDNILLYLTHVFIQKNVHADKFLYI